MARVLGIDFGTRRIGAAISDPRRMIATPLEVYERRDAAQDARHYRALAIEHEVDLAVVGLPLHTGGREGTSAGLARSWGVWLAGRASRSPTSTSVTPPSRPRTPSSPPD